MGRKRLLSSVRYAAAGLVLLPETIPPFLVGRRGVFRAPYLLTGGGLVHGFFFLFTTT